MKDTRTLAPIEASTVKEAIEDALAEVEICEYISEGVETKLREALEILTYE